MCEKLGEYEESLPEKINFKLDIGIGRAEHIITYNQLLEHIERAKQEDERLFRFTEITGHQGPLKAGDPDYRGSPYNVNVLRDTGEITTEPLNMIASDDPVTCAVYAKKHDLLELPGWKRFKHLAKNQKKLARVINQTKMRQARTTPVYMFGYRVPKDYKEAIELDKQNGNSKWFDAVETEMAQIKEYNVFKDGGKAIFDNHKKVTNAPTNHRKIRVHLVFAVKHDGRHKARLVAGGHLTPEPVESIYSGVVTTRSLRLVIFLAKLDELELWGADKGNAYLEAFTDELLFIVAGPEFGELAGHILIFLKALYGLRSSELRWAEKIHDVLKDMGYTPSKADGCVWMKKSKDGTKYFYIAVYVDDLLIAHEDPASIIKELKEKYNFKIKGDGNLEYQLGCEYVLDPDGTLAASPKKYIGKILDSYKSMFGEEPKIFKSPLEKNNHPELDNTDLVDSNGIQTFMSMIGQLQWAITLGRFDIMSQVVSLSRFRLAPRIGHIDHAKRIYGYLQKTKHYALRFCTMMPTYDELPKQNHDWIRSVYGEVMEEIPDNAPESLGKEVMISTYLDANLTHCMATGRAATAVLHFVNMTPIEWYSKRQATVETATYGSEFVAAKTAGKQIMDLRHTLRYMGVPIKQKTYMFGDNQPVITSCTPSLHAQQEAQHLSTSLGARSNCCRNP
ncbi:hypothetical protein ACA910_011415 [Epithemia clementina (nom. ined.)]